jgi:hypothetical protein
MLPEAGSPLGAGSHGSQEWQPLQRVVDASSLDRSDGKNMEHPECQIINTGPPAQGSGQAQLLSWWGEARP